MAQNGPGDRELLDHLVAEFGDRGRDAVGFLETAQWLVDVDDAGGHAPRLAGAAAYCIREALVRLLPAESGRVSWRKLSDGVVDAKRQLEAVRGLPGADEAATEALDELLIAIDRLEEFKRNDQGQHQRRLAELMRARAGAPPLSAPLREYQRLLRDLNDDAVHAAASIEQVRELLGRAIAVLRTIFAPFQLRQPELDLLAQLPDPGEEDAQRLLALCSTPHHLRYFMQHVVAPKWLFLLTPSGVLDPPADGGVWPVGFAAERLARADPGKVAAWLEAAYARWGATPAGAAYVAAAARDCLPAASATLLRALREHPGSNWIRGQAMHALKVMVPTSAFAEDAAAVLLDPGDEMDLAGIAAPTIQVLLDGMTPDNADARITLLARRLATGAEARYLEFLSPSGSVEDIAEDEGRALGALLKGVIAAVRRSREIGLQTDRVLALLEPIPGGLLDRLRAWVLHDATDLPPQRLVAEVARTIAGRDPTGDDVRLIQRVADELSGDLYVESWRDAMGLPPAPEEVGRALASHEIPPAWRRTLLWHPLLPEVVREAWETAVMLMSPVMRPPTRDVYLQPPSDVELGWARSPMSKAELEGLGVDDAARKIASWRPTGEHLIIARELGRTLQELVAADPRAWASRPLPTLALLRHPTYVHHYFEGLALTSGDLSGLGPGLIEAVLFARTHPWEPVRLGDDDFDYDPTWAPADEAGVRLIGRLAERDVDLGDRYDDAWRIVVAAARDRSGQSGVSRREDQREDPLETAINRPCTKALQAMFQLLGTEFRRDGSVRQEGLQLLDEALLLDGWDGAEHRAIIAPRLPFLLHVAPEWVQRCEAMLFGAEAPGGLGQRTVELALRWGRPNRWLLERHRRAILRAVRASAANALSHVLIAMLWDVPGYAAEETFRKLAPMGPSVMSDAGERLARLLRNDDVEQQHIERGVRFWELALAEPSLRSEAFRGFGWWAEVDRLDKDHWEKLTLATSGRAEGSLAGCVKVAERCAREPITTSGLRILTGLLRGDHDPWDRALVAEVALGALQTSANNPALSDAPDRLRAALTDLGHFEAEGT